jgi:hypothetical protein
MRFSLRRGWIRGRRYSAIPAAAQYGAAAGSLV